MNPTAQKKEFDTALGGLTPQERAAYTKANPTVGVGGTQMSFNQPTGSYNPIETTLSSDRVADVRPMTVKSPQTSTTAAGWGAELTSLSNAGIEELDKQDKLMADTAAAATTAKTELDSTTKAVSDFLGERKGESALTDEQYGTTNDLGTTVNDTGKKLREVNAKINAIDIRQNEQIKQIQGDGGKTLVQAGNEIRAIQRLAATDKADLYIEKLIAQGDYDTAKEIANRKVDVEMEQDKLDFEKLMFDYEENKDRFTKAEQRQFEMAADDRKRKLDEESAMRKELARIEIDKQDPMKVLELENQRLQNEKLRNEVSTFSDGGNSNDLQAYASQYADTGKLPSPAELKLSGLSVGQVTAKAKEMPHPSGSLVSNKTNVKSSALSPAQEDGILALFDISQKVEELKTLEDKRIKGLTSAAFGKVFGATDQENYLNLRTEIVDLLSRARTGAALTASEEKFYADQLPGRIGQVGFGLFGANTQNKINNFGTKIKGTLDTKLNGQDLSIYGYSKVKVGDEDRTVGEVLDIGGVQYKVLPDGTLTDII